MIATQERQLNIKEFSLPEPRVDSVIGFDPKRDITDQEYIAFMEYLIEEDDHAEYINHAGMLSFLFPDMQWNERYTLSQSRSERIKDDFMVSDSPFTADMQLERLFLAKKVFPEFVVGDYVFDHAKELLGKNTAYDDYYGQLFYGHLLFPKLKAEMSEVPGIPAAAEEEFNKDIKYERSAGKLELLIQLKTLDPKKFKYTPLSSNEWTRAKNGMHELVDTGVEANVGIALRMAFNMYVLSAERIEHADTGPKFIMPSVSQALDQKSPMPNRRRF